MKNVRWNLEEAVALYDLYFKHAKYTMLTDYELENLRQMYVNRADVLHIDYDEKFRNLNGLRMQLGCIHYVVTKGAEGFSNVSKLFYETYDLYSLNRQQFDTILKEFYRKYK